MTRRSWLQRALAGAVFVAHTNFFTLVREPQTIVITLQTPIDWRVCSKVFLDTINRDTMAKAEAMTVALFDAMRKQGYRLPT